jgi:TPR repeat protein
MRMLLMSLVLALGLASLAPATAGPLEDGVAADEAGDYAEAFLRILEQEAEQGDADARRKLGFMYEFGYDVPQDYAEAARGYRLEAEQGYASAQFFLGLMYEFGNGVMQDDAEAVKWYRLAAEQGYALAQGALGVMYNKDRGVVHDARTTVIRPRIP